MSVTRVLSLNNGIQTEVVPNTTSAGAGDAGKLIALNSSGLVDSSMLPSSGGSSGPSMTVPRDLNWHVANVYPEAGGFSVVGMYIGNSTGSTSYSSDPEPAGYMYAATDTGTTASNPVGFVSTKYILAGKSPSFRVIYGLSSASDVQCYLGLAAYCNPSMASVDMTSSGVAFIGFRYFSASDNGNWHAYLGDGSSFVTADTGIAVDTTKMHVFDVVYVAGVPQFYIDTVRVASAIPTGTLPDPTGELGIVAIHMNTTASSVVSHTNQLYFGAN